MRVGRRSTRRPTTASRSSPTTRGSTTRDLVEQRRAGRRPPQRHRHERRASREGLEAVTTTARRVGQAGLGCWGKNLVRNFDELAELALALRPSPEERASAFARRYPDARCTATSTSCWPTTALDAVVDRDAGADALRAREAGARGGQARLRREAAGDARRGDGGARATLAERARPACSCRATCCSTTRACEAEGAGRRGRARRRALRLRQPPEPRASSARTRTRSGRSACTTSR